VLGQDFNEPSSLQVTFSSGDVVGATACATFGIINDNNLELDHEFTVSLSTVTPTGPNLSAAPSSTTVTIFDDEGIHCIMLNILIINFCWHITIYNACKYIVEQQPILFNACRLKT